MATLRLRFHRVARGRVPRACVVLVGFAPHRCGGANDPKAVRLRPISSEQSSARCGACVTLDRSVEPLIRAHASTSPISDAASSRQGRRAPVPPARAIAFDPAPCPERSPASHRVTSPPRIVPARERASPTLGAFRRVVPAMRIAGGAYPMGVALCSSVTGFVHATALAVHRARSCVLEGILSSPARSSPARERSLA